MQFFIAIALLVASYLLTSLTMKNQTNTQKPAAFEDFDFPQASENTPQAVVFGDVWISDWMVLWVGDYRVTPIKKKGGKK